jgi:hypothetical protein
MWVDNNKMDLKVIGRNGKVSIYLAQDKNKWKDLLTTVMDFGVPRLAEIF